MGAHTHCTVAVLNCELTGPRRVQCLIGSSGEIGITEYRPIIESCRGRQGEKVGNATLHTSQPSYLHRYRRQFSSVTNRTTSIPTAPRSPH